MRDVCVYVYAIHLHIVRISIYAHKHMFTHISVATLSFVIPSERLGATCQQSEITSEGPCDP